MWAHNSPSPLQGHQFRIYGPKNGLLPDQDNETLIKLRGGRYKSYLEQFAPPVNFALQYAGNFRENLRLFLANDFHPKAGMKFLIESFYRSVVENAPLPIPYREIVLTSQIMDKIFRGLDSNSIGPADMERIFDTTRMSTAQPASR